MTSEPVKVETLITNAPIEACFEKSCLWNKNMQIHPHSWVFVLYSLRYKFDIQCLINPKFNHCSVIWNHYESYVSSQLLANVAVLSDMLHFRDNRSLCMQWYIWCWWDWCCYKVYLYWVTIFLFLTYILISLFMLYPVYDFNNKQLNDSDSSALKFSKVVVFVHIIRI